MRRPVQFRKMLSYGSVLRVDLRGQKIRLLSQVAPASPRIQLDFLQDEDESYMNQRKQDIWASEQTASSARTRNKALHLVENLTGPPKIRPADVGACAILCSREVAEAGNEAGEVGANVKHPPYYTISNWPAIPTFAARCCSRGNHTLPQAPFFLATCPALMLGNSMPG